MHPAYSVIAFTTLSGAGYGLLVWLALEAGFGAVADDATLGFTAMALALGLIAAGLLASTAHLGRPERAWRAFSQWRTSWLSREGVLAVATFVPALLLALVWIVFGGPGWLLALLALPTIALALATVWSTGMIYQSLPTIRAWHMPLVAPIYVALALSSGAVLAYALLLAFARPATGTANLAILAVAIAAALKLAYWQRIDTAKKTWTAGAATGLGSLGKVRSLDPPHTQANSVMREMGYAVGRKHAAKLRRIALALGFAVPAAALLASLAAGPIVALALAVLAAVATMLGILVERWLFFAEARHVVTVFYGADAA